MKELSVQHFTLIQIFVMGRNCKYLTNFLDAFEGGWELVDVESWFVPPFSCYKKTKMALCK